MCDHLEKHSIDEALVTGAPYGSAAKRFELSESAVYRHNTEHLLVAHLLRVREVEEAARADDLLEHVRTLKTHTFGILIYAEKAGDLRTALAAISQARGKMELLGKLGEAEGLAALHGWLQSGGQFYTPPATLSIDNLVHARRRELRLAGVGVIG